jgi:NarL family two-component system response regulator LiaR
MAGRKATHQLTSRELQVVQLVAAGWSNKRIAAELCMTLRTVKFHTTNIYSKIRASSRAEAIAWAWKHGDIMSPPER